MGRASERQEVWSSQLVSRNTAMSAWVISGHLVTSGRCPLCPRKRTFTDAISASALCQ
jgi:hypothetical protein